MGFKTRALEVFWHDIGKLNLTKEGVQLVSQQRRWPRRGIAAAQSYKFKKHEVASYEDNFNGWVVRTEGLDVRKVLRRWADEAWAKCDGKSKWTWRL